MASSPETLTILCLASYEKGAEFMRECRRQGCRVLLLTSQSIGLDPWPRESIDELFLMHDVEKHWNLDHVIKSVSYLARREQIDLIVPLDDFDLETAAALREHLRVPGMGESATRYFRDKLAMRIRAQEAGIRVPAFVHVLNDARVEAFMQRVAPPWLLKPRLEASATGIKKINSQDQFRDAVAKLGDKHSYHLLESYVPGDIYHVDSIVSERHVVFAEVHRYGKPPLDVAHGGGIFTTSTVTRGSEDEQRLLELNRQVLAAMGLVRGVSHTEFIRGREDGRFYFLETAARVGGAHIVELIEAATGLNLWAEWAKIEIARGERQYQLPPYRSDYGGLIVSLARQQWPDTSAYQDPEIAWRLNKRAHVGLIVHSREQKRVEELLADYTRRFAEDFSATHPMPERPSS
ncbi:MAG TPA: ATP-grasp domain-containing protein [Pyrinomonadaceae bacterium]|jgi:biotin carboxylase